MAQPPPAPCLRLRLQAEPGAVRATLAQARFWLGGQNVPEPARDRCELVLAELLNNIVEHACAPQLPAMLRLILALGPEGLHICLSDPGRPMPGLRLPPARLPRLDVPLADLPEGGFGWPLVHRLAPSPAYRRRAGRNRLVLTLPHPPAHP